MLLIEELIIETTRRCNMSCPHCLRGEAENLNIGFNYIDKALEDVSSISYLTFTGGEPSLNVPAMVHTLNRCKEKGIVVSSFFVATNGKEVKWDFIQALIDWYCYTELDECSAVALSKDIFHEKISIDSLQMLQSLSFFSGEAKNNGTYEYGLINEGKAKKLSNYKKVKRKHYVNEYEFYDSDISVSGQIYISADGKVKNDCDTSYDNDECVIGDLNQESLLDIVKRDAKEE